MATIYYDQDADLSLIQGKKVAVLGYGSQGHAHSLNLRDSGVDVRVGLREGSPSRARAEEQGLRVLETNAAADEADVIVILAPDTHQKGMWEGGLAEAVRSGDTLVFGHGFNVHFGFVTPPEDVDVLAPVTGEVVEAAQHLGLDRQHRQRPSRHSHLRQRLRRETAHRSL
jgi:ketol-acid reductoisomerase